MISEVGDKTGGNRPREHCIYKCQSIFYLKLFKIYKNINFRSKIGPILAIQLREHLFSVVKYCLKSCLKSSPLLQNYNLNIINELHFPEIFILAVFMALTNNKGFGFIKISISKTQVIIKCCFILLKLSFGRIYLEKNHIVLEKKIEMKKFTDDNNNGHNVIIVVHITLWVS